MALKSTVKTKSGGRVLASKPKIHPVPMLPVNAQAPTVGMAVEQWPVDRPIPYARNARMIGERAVEKVAASIHEFGFRQPIVVDDQGVIIVGHTRLLAAKKLGLVVVPVHVAGNLTPPQVKAYRLADNRLNQETSWDSVLLGPEFEELKSAAFDLSLTGFEASEIGELLAADPGRTDADECPAVPEVPASIAGDCWLLGDHRLVCGDSTEVTAIDRLMAGAQAGMVFTDPPYNVDYDSEARPNGPTSQKRKDNPLGKIQNDRMTDEAFRTFLDAVYTSINLALLPGRSIYICHADTEGHHFRNAFIAQPWKLQSCLIWKKTVLVFGRADYHWMHEPILVGTKEADADDVNDGIDVPAPLVTHDPVLYGWKEGAGHYWAGGRKQTTVWEVPTDHCNKADADTDGYVHPTQKPVALIVRAIKNSSAFADPVLDLFGGSGSTLIACERTGRLARLMELDPRYCDVIVTRWQNFTGKEATLESDGRTFSAIAAQR